MAVEHIAFEVDAGDKKVQAAAQKSYSSLYKYSEAESN